MKRINIFICSFLMACSAFFSISAYADNDDVSVQQQFGMTFNQIKDAAAQGDPDAEYALGYMYYYGKGTPRDENAAKMWIEKAAAQGQPQATKALHMLGLVKNPKEGVAGPQINPSVGGAAPITPAVDSSANAQNGPNSQNGAPDNSMAATNDNNGPDANSSNGSANSMPTNAAATDSQTSPSAAVPTTMVSATDNNDQSSDSSVQRTPRKKTVAKTKNSTLMGSTLSKRKLLDAPPHFYTIQLLGSHHESDLARFVKAHNLQSKTVYYRSTSFEGRPWYVLVYGIYSSDAKAESAIKHLPAPLRKLNPWAKSVNSVKRAMHAENDH